MPRAQGGYGASSPRPGGRVRRRADSLGYVEREPILINSTFCRFIAFHHIPHRTIHERVHGIECLEIVPHKLIHARFEQGCARYFYLYISRFCVFSHLEYNCVVVKRRHCGTSI